ncbi:MAG: hypothetical protein ABW321_28490 [Polyangiales bacterium]
MKRVSVAMIGLVTTGLATTGLLATAGCAVSHDVGVSDDGQPSALTGPTELSERCRKDVADSPFGLPKNLSCTGLYADSDASSQTISDGVLEFAPQYLLWSDGLNKSRWLFLPKDSQIDATNSGQWVFPVGTRVWKEFRSPDEDKPVETRIYYKKGESDWVQNSYQWNDGLTEALRVDSAKDVELGSQTHWIPGPSDCNDCHKGRRDRVLGFEQVSLGLEKASGVTLEQLVAEERLKGFEGPTSYKIGEGKDDGTEAHALGWIHMNCGVTCHNDNTNATGKSIDMRLRLEPTLLDGRPAAEFPTITTTVGQDTQALQWSGRKRITAGSAADSWLYSLITQRGDEKNQMPPIGTRLVDEQDSAVVKKWIESLPKAN